MKLGISPKEYFRIINLTTLYFLVNSTAELDSGTFTFAPALTHQLFEDEIIRGYKGVKILIYYCGGSCKPSFLRLPTLKLLPQADLQTYLAVEYKEKQSKADDIEKRLLEFMPPQSITRDLPAFRKVCLLFLIS
jgi:hypothetical protein